MTTMTTSSRSTRARCRTPVRGTTIVDVFKETARAHADRPALRWRERGRSGGRSPGPNTSEAVTERRHRPARPGAWNTATVSASSPTNRPEWHIADIATLAAGLVTVPVYPTNAASQVGYVLGAQRRTSLLRRERRPVGQGPAPASGPPCAGARRRDGRRDRPRRRVHHVPRRSPCRGRGNAANRRPAGSTSSSRTVTADRSRHPRLHERHHRPAQGDDDHPRQRDGDDAQPDLVDRHTGPTTASCRSSRSATSPSARSATSGRSSVVPRPGSPGASPPSPRTCGPAGRRSSSPCPGCGRSSRTASSSTSAAQRGVRSTPGRSLPRGRRRPTCRPDRARTSSTDVLDRVVGQQDPPPARPRPRSDRRLRRRAGPSRPAALVPRHRPADRRGLRPDRGVAVHEHEHPERHPHRHRRPADPGRVGQDRRRRRDPRQGRQRVRRLLARRRGHPRADRRRRVAALAATSAGSTPTATSASPAARRTSSSPPTARTSRRRRSRPACGWSR